MTRANPRGPRFDFDPEIERTEKQLKKRIRSLMDGSRNNGQPPADGQGDVSARDNGSGLGRLSRLVQISAERLAELLAYV
ncbi:hypothetical protein V6N11_071206 [Hibiscus sabdariffa]|uniref:Uncharacterized protein n=1 Tax=Hibiscus sabdariffa TaxID=183260 RepID=A0ABR2TZD7_9ROSI